MAAKNPIEEIWRIRDQIAAECGYDVNRLFERIRALEARDKDRVVQPPPRRAPMKSAATLEPVMNFSKNVLYKFAHHTHYAWDGNQTRELRE